MGVYEQRYTATETVSTTIKHVAEEMAKLPPAARRVQEQMRDIHAKGDPLKELERQAEKQLTTLTIYGKKELAKTEEIAKAKAAVIARFERERAALIKRRSEEEEKAEGKSKVTAQQYAKSWREPLSAVMSMANGTAAAFGQAGIKAASMATGIAGAFATGGAAGLAIGGTITLVNALAGKWTEVRDRTVEAQQAIVELKIQRAATIEEQIKLAEEYLAEITGTKPTERQRFAKLATGTQEIFGETVARRGKAQAEVDRLERSIAKSREEDERIVAAGGSAIAGARERAILQESLKAAKDRVAELDREIQRVGHLLSVYQRIGMAPEAPKAGAAGGGGVAAAGIVRGPAAVEPPLSLEERLAQIRAQQDASHAAFRADYLAEQSKVNELNATQEFARSLGIGGAVATAVTAEEEQKKFEFAGDAIGAGLGAGIANFFKTKDPMDLIGPFVNAAVGILSNVLFPGGGFAAGLFGGLFGGLFREGGSPALPQGRAGLAAWPGLNFDAIPAYFKHPAEYTLSAPAVAAAGGLQVVDQYNRAARAGLPMGGGPTVQVTANVQALDPMAVVDVIREAVGPALSRYLGDGSGGLLSSSIATAAMRPRAT